MDDVERSFIESPTVLSKIYGHLVAQYSDIRHVYVVDNDVFQFLFTHNDAVSLLQYS